MGPRQFTAQRYGENVNETYDNTNPIPARTPPRLAHLLELQLLPRQSSQAVLLHPLVSQLSATRQFLVSHQRQVQQPSPLALLPH